jgi:diguanylate cyclase (GGDEF)-like protein
VKSLRPRRAGTRLFGVYAAVSLVPIALLGASQLRDFDHEALAQALDQGRAQASVINQMAIAPSLASARGDVTAEALEAGLTARMQERLAQATDLSIFQGSVMRLRLRSFSGKVLFSDDSSSANALAAGDPAFVAATLGGTSADIVDVPGVGDSIRVLQSVTPNASGQAVGVLEVYLPYDQIRARLADRVLRATRRLAVGLAVLYAVLGAISWSTTRRLRRHATESEHAALHDPLTGLANRVLFERCLQEAVDRGTDAAVVLADLDHFKEVNDLLGHHEGDRLLVEVAGRLTSALAPDGVVARLGGDEFGVLLPGRWEPGELRSRLAAAREAVVGDGLLSGTPVRVEASFGAVLHPEHGRSTEDLLRRADAAMYRAKHGAHGGVVVHRGDADGEGPTALLVHGELRQALARGELVLHYQPLVDLGTGATARLEALVRWQHPVRGLLPPAHFLPVAEQSDLIAPLTHWVLRQAVADLAGWTATWDAPGEPWSVAVNLSARVLGDPALPHLVADVLSEHGVPPAQLCLELTETALAEDPEEAERVLGLLASTGVVLAVDDFGTGFTSLRQLRSSWVGEVKIDGLFARGVSQDRQNQAVVRSVLELAHSLGRTVTAECVETQADLDWLAQAGCDLAQGYLLSPPRPLDELRSTHALAVSLEGTT